MFRSLPGAALRWQLQGPSNIRFSGMSDTVCARVSGVLGADLRGLAIGREPHRFCVWGWAVLPAAQAGSPPYNVVSSAQEVACAGLTG